MKIFYCFFEASYQQFSVQNKVLNQIRAFNNAGAECEGVFFTVEEEQANSISNQISFVHLPKIAKPRFLSIRLLNNKMLAFERFLENNYSKADIFYVRYPTGSRILFRILKKFGDKIVFEHQGKEESHVKFGYQYHQFSLKPSQFFSWFEYYFMALYNEKIWGSKLLKYARASISVTPEIAEYQQLRSGIEKNRVFSVGNGYSVQSIGSIPSRNFDGKRLKLLMLLGGSADADYYGVNYILQGLENYSGPVQVEFHVAGIVPKVYEKNPLLIQHGFLTNSDLQELLDTCHIGIGGFDTKQIQQKQGSNLKMREYAANGIPVVFGVEDVDFIPFLKEKLCLRLTPDQMMNIQSVIDFASQFYLHSNLNTNRLRELSLGLLDFDSKAKEILRFIQTTEK